MGMRRPGGLSHDCPKSFRLKNANAAPASFALPTGRATRNRTFSYGRRYPVLPMSLPPTGSLRAANSAVRQSPDLCPAQGSSSISRTR